MKVLDDLLFDFDESKLKSKVKETLDVRRRTNGKQVQYS